MPDGIERPNQSNGTEAESERLNREAHELQRASSKQSDKGGLDKKTGLPNTTVSNSTESTELGREVRFNGERFHLVGKGSNSVVIQSTMQGQLGWRSLASEAITVSEDKLKSQFEEIQCGKEVRYIRKGQISGSAFELRALGGDLVLSEDRRTEVVENARLASLQKDSASPSTKDIARSVDAAKVETAKKKGATDQPTKEASVHPIGEKTAAERLVPPPVLPVPEQLRGDEIKIAHDGTVSKGKVRPGDTGIRKPLEAAPALGQKEIELLRQQANELEKSGTEKDRTTAEQLRKTVDTLEGKSGEAAKRAANQLMHSRMLNQLSEQLPKAGDVSAQLKTNKNSYGPLQVFRARGIAIGILVEAALWYYSYSQDRTTIRPLKRAE